MTSYNIKVSFMWMFATPRGMIAEFQLDIALRGFCTAQSMIIFNLYQAFKHTRWSETIFQLAPRWGDKCHLWLILVIKGAYDYKQYQKHPSRLRATLHTPPGRSRLHRSASVGLPASRTACRARQSDRSSIKYSVIALKS
jgi:hypothetical protein